uniref:hypothetical protein n=1 Tax=Clostridium sp. 12(A) TaxID=1163671 RepID=UPI000463ECD9|nr:hypothetical protein [Clostridium sp. 12(A)]
MLDLIDDIETALLSDNLRCALGMALTLPDICGQIEFPTQKDVGKRYTGWCEKYLFNQGCHSHIPFTENIPDSEQRVISPEICYKLRCAYLHSGNLELNQRKGDSFIEFRLIISHPQDEGIYVETVVKDQYMTIDIRHLTRVICDTAKEYYSNHNSKEDFQSKHIRIIDVTRESEKVSAFLERKNEIDDRENALLDYNQLSKGAKKLLEDIQSGRNNVSSLTKAGREITQEETDLMIQYYELIKGGFLIFKS